MKKDIIIPKVENVYVAAIQEWNDDFMAKTWYAYLVNDSDFALENVIVVSTATGLIAGEERKTSMLRHAFVEVPAVSAVKIEMIEDSVLVLDNSFMLSYFIGNTLYDKNFVFKSGAINETDVEEIPVVWKDGIMIE